MPPRQKRLRRHEIAFLVKNGKRVRTHVLSSCFLPSPSPAVAVVIGKKIEPKAVSRNRMRRRIRAVATPLLTHDPSLRVVIYALKGSESASFQELKNECEAVFEHMWRILQHKT